MLKSDFSANRVPHEAMRKSLSIMYENGAYLTPSVAKQIMKLFSDASIGDKMKKVKEKFASIFQGDADEKYKGTELTKMQKLVLGKIVDGMTTAEIATDLELSENTINTHIKAIYSILGVHSRALAIKKAMELKWSLWFPQNFRPSPILVKKNPARSPTFIILSPPWRKGESSSG